MLKSLTVSMLVVLGVAGCGGGNKMTQPSIPQYVGVWQGTYLVSGCAQNGDIGTVLNVCASFTNGSQLQVTFYLNQVDRSISGRFYMGTLQFDVAPTTIASDNSLTLVGPNTLGSATLSILGTWNLRLASDSTFAGNVTAVWTSGVATGNATVSGTINFVQRLSTIVTFPPATTVAPSSLGTAIQSVMN